MPTVSSMFRPSCCFYSRECCLIIICCRHLSSDITRRCCAAALAQLVERMAFNHVVLGSSPKRGDVTNIAEY